MSGDHPAPCLRCSETAEQGKLLCARCGLAQRLDSEAYRLNAGGFDGNLVALLREAAKAIEA